MVKVMNGLLKRKSAGASSAPRLLVFLNKLQTDDHRSEALRGP